VSVETDEFLTRFEERRAAREHADRTVTIAGEKLVYRPTVAPEVGLRLEAMRQKVVEQLERLRDAAQKAERDTAAAEGNGTDVDLTALNDALERMEVSDEDMLLIGDETVLACLEPSSHPAWARLRDPAATQPLTFDEVFELADYLLGRVAGVPTSAPADSSDGRTETSRSSKGRSSSPAKIPTLST
jgi:hypothetical protein